MQKVQLNEYTANYYEVGEGRTLVFLHGFLEDCHVWDSLIPYLSSDYRCICLDLLGFGNSSAPDIAYTIASEVEFVSEFIEFLSLKDYTFVGHSFGGWISSYFSIHQPSKDLNSIVLLAAGGIRDDDFDGGHKYIIPLLFPNRLIDIAISILSPFLSLIGFGGAVKHFKKFRKLFRDKPIASAFLLKQFTQKDTVKETVDHLLDEIDVLTLVISGDIDKTIPLWHSETYANKVRNSHSLFIPDAAHNLIATHPKIISDKILEIIPTESEVHRS